MEANQPTGGLETLPRYKVADRSQVGDMDHNAPRNSFLLDMIAAVVHHGGEVFLLWVGIPPSLFLRFHNKRLSGRFWLSGYSILMLLTLSFGMMAIVFAVVGRGSGPSAGVGIAAAGFAAIGLSVLKEHRENFPDFAPWLFEKDYKTDSVVAVLLVALIGIGRLPLAIYIYAVHPEVTKVAPQAKTFLYALGFEVSAGNFVLPLGLYNELTGGRAHRKEEEEEDSFIWRLIWEEMWIVFPRYLLLLIIRKNPIQAAKVLQGFSVIAVYDVVTLFLMYLFRKDKVGAERSDGHKDGSGEGKITTSPASPVTDEKGYSDGV